MQLIYLTSHFVVIGIALLGMSLARFNFIINCLRFDSKNTRDKRNTIIKFAPISDISDTLVKNCQKWYKPGLYLTIDEQLVGF